MSFNGSGVFNLYTPGNPVVTGTTISSSWANNTLSDIATGLSTAICKDGQTTVTANIPMASHKLTGLSAGTTNGDSVRYEQLTAISGNIQSDIQSGTYVALGTIAGTNTITAVANPTLLAYAANKTFRFIPANTNTGATTINIDGLGARNVFWNGAACAGAEIRQNVPCEIFDDGTRFHIIGNGFTAPFSDAFAVVEGSVDATKRVRFEVDGLTTATTRVVTIPDADVTIAQAASQAQQETGTSIVVYTSPGTQQFHPSALKAWGNLNGTGTAALRASYNLDAITDNNTGDYTWNFTTDFSSANYGVTMMGGTASGILGSYGSIYGAGAAPAAGTIRTYWQNINGSNADPEYACLMAAGDQ